jgi:predicted phosphodiesterase
MSSWAAIENQSYLNSISLTVVNAVHHNDDKLDWELTVEDKSGKHFSLQIWQKHDPLIEWEAGNEYEIRNAYGQTWSNGQKKRLHSSGKWAVDRLEDSSDCRLMVMGDSHVGRKEHPSNPYQSIDCAGKFKEAIEAAMDYGVDCIVHTGDVFHDSVSEEDCEIVDSAFKQIQNVGIEFYYIRGNHECERGDRLLEHWKQQNVAVHLDMNGVAIAEDMMIYGYDHIHGSKFSVDDMDVPLFLSGSVSILVLHQTLAPATLGAKVDLDAINGKSADDFDYVVSGHHHDPKRSEWNNSEFLYAGSTEDISTNSDPSDPSVWFISVDGNAITTNRYKL